MPIYTYNCKKCLKSVDVIKRMSDPEATVHTEDDCGGDLVRDYGTINFKADQGKNDPGSPMFWKRGKTTEQISQVIEGTAAPY